MFLKILKDLLGLLYKVAEFFNAKKLMDAGRAHERAEKATEVIHDITKANEARDGARESGSGATSANQLPDDGFRRD